MSEATQNGATLRLPRIFSSGMVLQRDKEIAIWGWAKAGAHVEISIAQHTVEVSTGDDGKWEATLPPLPAGGPHSLFVKADTTIMLQDILIGEVWICSGQSNMELQMERVWERYEDDIRLSYNLGLRMFTVPGRFGYEKPEDDLDAGQWVAATPETVLQFSATAYFFARALFERYQVPVGIVCAAVGGSRAESWMSTETLEKYPEEYETALRWQDASFRKEFLEKEQQAVGAWYEQLHREDVGLHTEPSWFSPELDDSDWAPAQVPGYWNKAGMGEECGSVWYRSIVNVPADLAGKPAFLTMGRIVDADTAYLNGIRVGETPYQYPPRRYAVPAGLLRAGKNTLVVRIVNGAGVGGFSFGKKYEMRFLDGTVIDLEGTWCCKRGVTMPAAPRVLYHFLLPALLYNGMLAPIKGYTARGFTWYQGESNADASALYPDRLGTMLNEWRTIWKQGDMPFLYVQLPNFTSEGGAPEDSWAPMRDAQRMLLSIPETAMAVTIDVGEWNDLHPTTKKPVGERLALLARRYVYGEDIVACGPIIDSVSAEGASVRLRFLPDCGALMTRDGAALAGFELAGDDGCFHVAEARIDGDTVLVRANAVSAPRTVRYAWEGDPVAANLCAAGNLPASPFKETVQG